ncbi:MAG: hypothetical protein ACE5DU_06960, partial [Nitrosopumilus sp.]
MLSKNTSMLMIASVTTVMLFSLASSEEAFAHGRQVIPVHDLGDSIDRSITVVLGHNNEPTTAQESGKASGNHPMEVFIRDTRTGLNLSGATLTVDKYYYKNDKAFNKAAEKGFVPLETDVDVRGVHGDPGHYFARQILAKPGIYGYHVTGTVDYFGTGLVNIDVMAVCRDAPNPSVFNTPTFQGGFGCTADIDDDKFPGKK